MSQLSFAHKHSHQLGLPERSAPSRIGGVINFFPHLQQPHSFCQGVSHCVTLDTGGGPNGSDQSQKGHEIMKSCRVSWCLIHSDGRNFCAFLYYDDLVFCFLDCRPDPPDQIPKVTFSFSATALMKHEHWRLFTWLARRAASLWLVNPPEPTQILPCPRVVHRWEPHIGGDPNIKHQTWDCYYLLINKTSTITIPPASDVDQHSKVIDSFGTTKNIEKACACA